MKSFTVDQYKTDARQLNGMPMPNLEIDDVLVKVHAASINPPDSKIAAVEFKPILPYCTPFVLFIAWSCNGCRRHSRGVEPQFKFIRSIHT